MAINSVLFVQMDISRGIWCLLNDIFRSDRLSYSSHSPPFCRHLKYSVGDLWFGEWLRRRRPDAPTETWAGQTNQDVLTSPVAP